MVSAVFVGFFLVCFCPFSIFYHLPFFLFAHSFQSVPLLLTLYLIVFSSLLVLPRQTLSWIKPEQRLPSVNTQVAVPAPGCPGAGFGYVGAGGLWRELGRLFLLPCPGKVDTGSLSFQTALGTGKNPSWTNVLRHQTRFFLPSLCFKPAIQSNCLLSVLLTAVFYTAVMFRPSLFLLSVLALCSLCQVL